MWLGRVALPFVGALALTFTIGCGGGAEGDDAGAPDGASTDAINHPCPPIVSLLFSVDLRGMYRVVEHTRNDWGCDEGPDADEPAYVKLAREGFEYVLSRCDTAASDSCDEDWRVVLDVPVEDGWAGRSLVAQAACTSCGFVRTDASAVQTRAGQVEIRIETYGEWLDYWDLGDPRGCSQAAAEGRCADLPCVMFERIVGHRIE